LASDHDIIVVTETWLNTSVSDSEIFPDHYGVYRCDRHDGRKGGGVLIGLKNISDLVISDLSHTIVPNDLDGIFLSVVSRSHSLSFFICVIYIPPHFSSEIFEELLQNLINYFPLIPSRTNKRFIFLGDFNLPSNLGFEEILSFNMSILGLSQANHFVNSNNRLLDLVWTNIDSLAVQREVLPFLPEDSYHPTLLITLTSSPSSNLSYNRQSLGQAKLNHFPQWRFVPEGFSTCRNLLMNVSWDELFTMESVDLAVEHLYDVLSDILDRCFVRKSSCAPKRNYPSWFSSEIIELLSIKAHAHYIWKRTGDRELYLEFSDLRRKIKCIMKTTFNNYISKCESEFMHYPGKFWSFTKDTRKSDYLPSSMIYNESIFSDDQSISNTFADFFHSIFSPIPPSLDPQIALKGFNTSTTLSHIDLFSISTSDVISALRGMKDSVSVGPDSIPTSFLKYISSEISTPLTFIYNLSISSSSFPSLWKIAKIIPIFKSGDRSHILNYRPISILSSMGKLFESILFNQLITQIDPLISDSQHGFRPKRSTVSNLLVFSQFLRSSLDVGSQVDVIYTDFKKAFDLVNRDILLLRLAEIGCSFNAISLLASYLRNRLQFVRVRGYESSLFTSLSGVPQGSALAPLLFNVFVDSVSRVVHYSKLLLYADDLKLYHRITSADDCLQLQTDIDSIIHWSHSNKMDFSINKCKSISFTKSSNPICYTYVMSEVSLERVSLIRDLGVLLDSKLSFKSHMKSIINSCNSSLAFLIRHSRILKNSMVIRSLYFSLVMSKLEYCDIIWIPHDSSSILALERVQRRFARYLYYRLYGRYPSLSLFPSDFVLGMTGLSTLHSRRLFHLLKYLLLILNGYIFLPEILALIHFYIPPLNIRLHLRPLFLLPPSRTDIIRCSPISMALRLLNVLVNKYNFDPFSVSGPYDDNDVNIFTLLPLRECFFDSFI
jgi:Reverse transcriptase (RNA-dependent DNA polymerase)